MLGSVYFAAGMAAAKGLVERVPCKRRSSANSGAWLRRFDDVTGEENLRCKRNKQKNGNGKYFIIENK